MHSLLLRRAHRAGAGELARKLYAKHPSEGAYASTYAYSLHLLGHTPQGLQALESLGPQSLETPDVATYYGILLAANREWTKAPRFLDLAKRANLLPEEEDLIASAAPAGWRRAAWPQRRQRCPWPRNYRQTFRG